MKRTVSINEKQILFINSLFRSTHKEPIMIDITERKEGIPYKMEVIAGKVVCHRLHLPTGEVTTWSTFSDEEEIREYFRRCSF